MLIIPTEPIGSIPRPPELLDAIAREDPDSPRLEQAYRAAVKDTVERFEATGSPVVTDGEQRKYHDFWTYCVHGMKNTSPDGFAIPFAAGHTRRMLRLTGGPFRYVRYADEYLDVAREFATRPVKQAVISPSAMSLMYPPQGIDGYPRDEFIEDLVSEHEKEIRRCFDKGAHCVQVDFTVAKRRSDRGPLLRTSRTRRFHRAHWTARGGHRRAGRGGDRKRAPAGERAGRAHRGRAREPHEGRVPGNALARAAHAPGRDPRLGAPDAGPAALAGGPSQGAGDHRAQRPCPDAADRGPARHEPDHLGQAAPGHPAGDAGPVSGDPARLQQIIWNLVNNAIKFTARGGRVQVVLARVNSHIEISVADDGIGIEPQFLTHVFERFRQADASTTRRFGGLGLGLSIVKHLAELHGGTVRAQSAGQGQGATFVVHLPLTAVHHVSIQDARPHPRSAPAVSDFKPSARQAPQLLAEQRPDVLVSDIGMPEMDGYELIRRIRALDASGGGRTPAIAMTAFARSEDRTRALHSGFQVHVAKPVEPSELIATVASVVARERGVDPQHH